MAAGKGGAQGLLIGVVFCIVIILVQVFIAYKLSNQVDALEDQVQTSKQIAKESERKELAVRERLALVNELVHGTTADVDRDAVQRDVLDRAGKLLAEAVEKEKYLSPAYAKALDKNGKLVPRTYTDMLQLYNDLVVQVEAAVPELNFLIERKKEALADAGQTAASARERRRELDEQIDKHKQEYATLLNQKNRDAADYDVQKRRLLADKDQLLKDIEKLREDTSRKEAEQLSKISELEERILQITEKKKRSLADTEADGEVVFAEQGLGMAWVNIGRKHRLRRGLTFQVFQYIKGGTKKPKGMAEVRRLEDDMAQVAILEQFDRADPIVKGDYIASPLFDRNKDMVFVFVGEKLTNDRYEKSQIVRRIEEFGGRVDKQVTIDTDFIVAIKDAEQSDEFRKAVQFGVVILRESELLDFIGR